MAPPSKGDPTTPVSSARRSPPCRIANAPPWCSGTTRTCPMPRSPSPWGVDPGRWRRSCTGGSNACERWLTMTDDSTSPARGGAPDIEARLRHALIEKAGDEPVHGADWGDLVGRLASSTRRRQRVLAGAAALALLAGAAGGYLGEAAASPVPVATRGTVPRASSGGATASRGAAPSAGAMAMCPEGS